MDQKISRSKHLRQKLGRRSYAGSMENMGIMLMTVLRMKLLEKEKEIYRSKGPKKYSRRKKHKHRHSKGLDFHALDVEIKHMNQMTIPMVLIIRDPSLKPSCSKHQDIPHSPIFQIMTQRKE
jgi:hypothetical protein